MEADLRFTDPGQGARPSRRDFMRGQREDELSTPNLWKSLGALIGLLTGGLAIGAGMIWILVLLGA